MSKSLTRMARVLEVDCSGTGEDENGRPLWMVTLKRGWAFDGAAAAFEADPEGRFASHTRSGTVRELQEAIRFAQPCKCGRCRKERS